MMEYDKIIAYITNECADQEKDFIEKWIKNNKTEFNRIKYVWEKSGLEHIQEPNVDKAWLRINPEKSDKGNNNNKKGITILTNFKRIAAILVFAILIGFTINYLYNKGNIVETHFTKTENNSNVVQEVQLADGSTVWLNAGTKIHYPEKFGVSTRDIYLDGEAFFDVTRNEEKPFIVHSGNSLTKVLGTSFNVKLEKNGDVFVTVLTGKVALLDAANHRKNVEVEKNELGVFSDRQQTVSKQENNNSNFLAWKTKILTFDKMPLVSVCEILSGHFNRTLKIKDDSLKQINLTARYEQKSLDEVLEIMQLTLDIRYQQSDSCVVLYANK